MKLKHDELDTTIVRFLVILVFTGTIILLTYSFFGALFIRSPMLTEIPSYIHLLATGIIIILMISTYRMLIKLNQRIEIIYILITAAFFLRFLWMLIINPLPVSDFSFYHLFAHKISQGDFSPYDTTCLVFPHRYGFPLILGTVYSIFGSNIYVAMVFNIICSVLMIIPVYWIAKVCFNANTALAVIFLYAFWPSQVMYSPVISTEQLFTLLFIASLALYIYFINERNIWSGVICGLVLSISNFIRPIAPLLIIVFMLIYILKFYNKKFIKNLYIAAVPITAFIMAFMILKVLFASVTGIEYETSAGYNLMVGTNYEFNGIYNNQDASVLYNNNYEFDRVHQQAYKEALNRIKENPLNFVKLIERKFFIMWGDEFYAALWSLTNNNNLFAAKKSVKIFALSISQDYYMAVVLLSLIGLINIRRVKDIRLISFIPLIFLAHVISYTFLEVQSRYHYPVMPLILLLSAYGITEAPSIAEKIKGDVAA